MRVKAAVARTYGMPLQLETLELGEPHEGEVLIRLIASGVGLRDRQAIAGVIPMPLPFVPGSEAAGIVERVGPGVHSFAAGDAVIIAYASCGSCVHCEAGDTRRCTNFLPLNLAGRRLDGSSPFADDGRDVNGFFFGQSSFSTHTLCRAADAIKVDAEAALEVVAALGGEFLAGAAAVLNRSDAQLERGLVVTRADVAGLAACMVAQAKRISPVIIADPDEHRRTLALDVGATIAVPAVEGLSAVVKSLTVDGVRFALDTRADEAGRRASLESLTPDGICARMPSRSGSATSGETGQERLVDADRDIDAANLLPQLIALNARGALPVEKLVTFFPFELVNDALQAEATATVVKPVLRFSLGPFGDLDRAKSEGAAITEPAAEPEDDLPAPVDPVIAG